MLDYDGENFHGFRVKSICKYADWQLAAASESAQNRTLALHRLSGRLMVQAGTDCGCIALFPRLNGKCTLACRRAHLGRWEGVV